MTWFSNFINKIDFHDLIILGTIFSIISLCSYTIYRTNKINNSLTAIENNTKKISILQSDIKANNKQMEAATIKYFTENFGETSKSAEDLAKLKYLFRQQEARLTNLENALSR
ncbi:MAG: hypothetical protein OEM02_02840 [Desulfobulbaceae bacterium]|nr:hypothetical protein [Desulfobulbaceae bacterium]